MRTAKQVAVWTTAKAQAKATEFWGELERKGLKEEDLKGAEKAAEVLTEDKKKSRRHMPQVRFVRRILASTLFQALIMGTIIANSVTIALESEIQSKSTLIGTADLPKAYEILDLVYLAIYSIEFVLKLYSSPKNYWKSNYNKFDFVILVLSYFQWILNLVGAHLVNLTFLRIIRALRALRAFRSISFVRSLQIIVSALTQTIRRDVVNLVLLLLLFLFIFGVLGHYLFGMNESDPRAYNLYGNLGSSFRSLWVIAVNDGWAHYQNALNLDGIPMSSIVFTVFFNFFGNLVWQNLFVGVVTENIQVAQKEDKRQQMAKLRASKLMKRELFLRKQRSDMTQLIAQKADRSQSMQEVLAKLAGSLRHDDILPMNHLSCNVMWMETYLISLHYHENTLYRIQQTHFHIANTLAEIIDRKLKARLKQEKQ